MRTARRGLCIGIATYQSPDAEPESDGYGNLPFAGERAEAVSAALSRLGYTCIVTPEDALPTAEELGALITEELTAREPGGEQIVQVVHVVSHGELAQSGTYLVGRDGRRAPTTDISSWIRSLEDFKHEDRPTTLFLIDTCHAGSAARLSWLPAADSNTRAWVIAATPASDVAYDGVFSRAVAEVLTDIVDGTLDLYPSPYVPFGSLVELIRTRVAQLEDGFGQYVTGTPVDGSPAPPFISNPRQPSHQELARFTQDAHDSLRPFVDLEATLDASHFTDRAGGRLAGKSSADSELQGCFTGRSAELEGIARWIENGEGSIRVVTGGPGSGKSALLGVLVCAAHPDLHEITRHLWGAVRESLLPAVQPRFAAIHLRERTLEEAVSGIANQLGLDLDPASPGITQLIPALHQLPDPPVIVVDALDEAVRQQEVRDRLLIPLVDLMRDDDRPTCRLIVGMRPWQMFAPITEAAREQDGLIDLDDVPLETLRQDLRTYASDMFSIAAYPLATRRALADGIAAILTPSETTRGGEFLAAALYVNWVMTHYPEGVDDPEVDSIIRRTPRTIPELLNIDLATELPGQSDIETWMRPVLTVVALTRGSGIPASIICRMADVFAEDSDGLTSSKLRSVLERVRFYLRSNPETDGTTLYRLFHQGLVDHLRPDEAKLSAAYDTLMALSPRRRGKRDFDASEPYVAHHYIEHAVDAGRLDELLDVHGPELDQIFTATRTGIGRLGRAIWRQRGTTSSLSEAEARDAMLLNAFRFNAEAIVDHLAHCSWLPPSALEPVWSTGGELESPELRSTITIGSPILRLATTSIDDVPVVICGSANGQVQCWSLTYQTILWDFETPSWTLREMRLIEVDGSEYIEVEQVSTKQSPVSPVKVMWDITAERLVRENARVDIARRGRSKAALTLRTSDADGPRQLRLWDPAARRIVGAPLLGPTDALISVARAVGPVSAAVTGGRDQLIRTWSLETGEESGPPLIGHRQAVNNIATTIIGRRPVIVSGSVDGTVKLWDLTTEARTQPRAATEAHTDWIQTIAWTNLDGQDVALTGGYDNDVRLWSFHHESIEDQTLIQHDNTVRAIACGLRDGRPFAASVADDGLLKITDIASGELLASWSLETWGFSVKVCTVGGRPTVLAGDGRGRVHRFDIDTLQPLGDPLALHTGPVWAIGVDSSQDPAIVISGGDDRILKMWRADDGANEVVGGHDDAVWCLDCHTIDGTRIAVSGGDDHTVRVWDLEQRTRVGPILRGHTARVRSVTASVVDGRPIAISSGYDRSLRIWDLVSYRQVGQFTLPAAACAVALDTEDHLLVGFSHQVARFRIVVGRLADA